MTNNELGARIRARREYLGLSQAEVAEAFNVARPTMNQYEQGKRAIDASEMPRLAKILKVSVAYFYGEDEFAADDQDLKRPQIIAFYDGMNEEGKDDLLALAKTVWERKRKYEHVYGRKAETEEEEASEE